MIKLIKYAFFQERQIEKANNQVNIIDLSLLSYLRVDNTDLEEMVFNDSFLNCLNKFWAITPDHVVFLDKEAYLFNDMATFREYKDKNSKPELVFIKNIGDYFRDEINNDKLEQLYFYYDTISRVKNLKDINLLDKKEVEKLVGLESEKYRIQKSKGKRNK